MDRPHVTLLLAALFSAAIATAEDFTVVALPDTQHYSEDYPGIYTAQTQWCVDQYAAAPWNVVFVTHLGDIVDNSEHLWEWDNAETAMRLLDNGGVPYGTCVGNHDLRYPGGYYDPTGTNYLSKFDPVFYAGHSWYGGASPSGLSNYQLLTVGQRTYLFLHLLVETPAAELAWAQQVLNEHRDKPTMVSTHRYLYDWRVLGQGRYGDFQYTFEPLYRHDGIRANDFFNNFVAVNRQIYMVICGHCDGQYRQISTNAAGRNVHEILVDYQTSWDSGGSGYLRLMTFRPELNQIETRSYSPWLDDWNPGGDDTFTLAVDFDDYAAAHPTIRFQNGQGGYSGTKDTWVGEHDPDTAHGQSTIVVVDDDTENSWFGDDVGQGLFRFDSITQPAVYEGDPAPTRVPVGATVLSATISLNLADDTDAWDPDFYCHRMTRDWSEGSTWNALGDGLSPGADCDSVPFAVFQGDNNPDNDYHRSFDARDVVQLWVDNPGTNYGFCVLPERDKAAAPHAADPDGDARFYDDGIEVRSSEEGDTPLRPALDIAFTYDVLNRPPTIEAGFCASAAPIECVTDLTVNEGREIRLSVTATDPNPLDPLVLSINEVDRAYATGGGELACWELMVDDGTYAYDAVLRDDEDAVAAGSVLVTVLNVAPTIDELTPDLEVAPGETFTFSALASDPGVDDLLLYTWDLDDDDAYDDFVGDTGTWSFTVPGLHAVRVMVLDDDGGAATAGFTVNVRVPGACSGDSNCDGAVNWRDIDYFVAAQNDNTSAWEAMFAPDLPTCPFGNNDVDGSGSVNWRDIDPFVSAQNTTCP